MSYPVTYYCPRCGTLAELEREGYLADKSVTLYPLEGWTYAAPTEPFETDAFDGVRFVCGEQASGLDWQPAPDGVASGDSDGDVTGTTASEDAADDSNEALGCGEPFYLSFVRFEDGREIEGRTVSERVRLAESTGPDTPSGPSAGGFY